MTEVAFEDREARLSAFWKQRLSYNLRIRQYVLRDWRLTWQALGDTFSLQQFKAQFNYSTEGKIIKQSLGRSIFGFFTLAQTGACILSIPKVPTDYSVGSNKQTLRRKTRSAEKAGIVCRVISDETEQRKLIDQLDRALGSKADRRYRAPNADHRFLVGIGLWSVAYGQDREPLVIAVVPRDGAWALLRLFISLGQTPQHSDARYLLTQFMVERLSHEGVEQLVDTVSPCELTIGLHHFQRMLGFRIARVKIMNDTHPRTTRSFDNILKFIHKAITRDIRLSYREIVQSNIPETFETKS